MLDVLRQRRSIRLYKETPVTREQVAQMTEALLRAPSSRGFRPWEFIIVDDQAMLGKMALAKEHGSAFLAKAPLAIVIAADTRKSDVWIEDCAIAAVILQLTAETLGLGSCWVQVRNRQHSAERTASAYLKQLFRLPEHYEIDCVIGLGVPAEEKSSHAIESLPHKQVHFGVFESG